MCRAPTDAIPTPQPVAALGSGRGGPHTPERMRLNETVKRLRDMTDRGFPLQPTEANYLFAEADALRRQRDAAMRETERLLAELDAVRGERDAAVDALLRATQAIRPHYKARDVMHAHPLAAALLAERHYTPSPAAAPGVEP